MAEGAEGMNKYYLVTVNAESKKGDRFNSHYVTDGIESLFEVLHGYTAVTLTIVNTLEVSKEFFEKWKDELAIN